MRDIVRFVFFFFFVCGVKFERFDCSKFVPLAHKMRNFHKNIHHVSNAHSSIYIIHIQWDHHRTTTCASTSARVALSSTFPSESRGRFTRAFYPPEGKLNRFSADDPFGTCVPESCGSSRRYPRMAETITSSEKTELRARITRSSGTPFLCSKRSESTRARGICSRFGRRRKRRNR